MKSPNPYGTVSAAGGAPSLTSAVVQRVMVASLYTSIPPVTMPLPYTGTVECTNVSSYAVRLQFSTQNVVIYDCLLPRRSSRVFNFGSVQPTTVAIIPCPVEVSGTLQRYGSPEGFTAGGLSNPPNMPPSGLGYIEICSSAVVVNSTAPLLRDTPTRVFDVFPIQASASYFAFRQSPSPDASIGLSQNTAYGYGAWTQWKITVVTPGTLTLYFDIGNGSYLNACYVAGDILGSMEGPVPNLELITADANFTGRFQGVREVFYE